ncbi:hypothetical protein PRtIB026_A14920 [Pseudomonas sp. RtIB026]|nr:hypothetical protein PRtIB026_A14920 [Pseudomonas sp. RtIB026]
MPRKGRKAAPALLNLSGHIPKIAKTLKGMGVTACCETSGKRGAFEDDAAALPQKDYDKKKQVARSHTHMNRNAPASRGVLGDQTELRCLSAQRTPS